MAFLSLCWIFKPPASYTAKHVLMLMWFYFYFKWEMTKGGIFYFMRTEQTKNVYRNCWMSCQSLGKYFSVWYTSCTTLVTFMSLCGIEIPPAHRNFSSTIRCKSNKAFFITHTTSTYSICPLLSKLVVQGSRYATQLIISVCTSLIFIKASCKCEHALNKTDKQIIRLSMSGGGGNKCM